MVVWNLLDLESSTSDLFLRGCLERPYHSLDRSRSSNNFIDNLYVKRTEQFMTPPVNSFECTPEIKEHMSGWCYPYSHRVDNSDWFGEC